MTVSPASPAITTTPSDDRRHAGHDVGDVERHGGAVWRLSRDRHDHVHALPGNTLVDTETVAVTGNGTYTTPTGYTLPTTGYGDGYLQWDAGYSGDTNNSSASENNADGRAGDGQPGQPCDHDDAERDRRSPGHDIGDVERHGSPLRRLYETGDRSRSRSTWGRRVVDTETVPVTGNGTYSTPTGYTLPARVR